MKEELYNEIWADVLEREANPQQKKHVSVDQLQYNDFNFLIKKLRQNSWFSLRTHDKKIKWGLAANEKMDMYWYASLQKDIEISIFNYCEKFDEQLFTPNLDDTKKMLLSFLDDETTAYILEQIKTLALGLENIWFNKYFFEFEKFQSDVVNESEAADYFFYKYYYEFLTAMRVMGMSLFSSIIVPNIILQNLSLNQRARFGTIDNNLGYKIFEGINSFIELVELVYNHCLEDYETELEELGADTFVGYGESTIGVISVIMPNLLINHDMWIKIFNKKMQENID